MQLLFRTFRDIVVDLRTMRFMPATASSRGQNGRWEKQGSGLYWHGDVSELLRFCLYQSRFGSNKK